MESKQDILAILLLLGLVTFFVIFLLSLFFILVRVYLKRIKTEVEQRHVLEINHQKELAVVTIEIQERERTRMAGELHDNLIAQLYRIKLSNEAPNINAMLKESIQKARALSHNLSPPMLEQVPIETLMLDYLEPFKKKYQIHTNLNRIGNKIIHKNIKLQLFRIFQEVLTNIDKHANASEIEVYYRFDSRYLCLMIKDNGVGFKTNDRTGLGLKNIALRTQILDSTYKIKQNHPKGTTFTILRYDNK
ncbi:MAG: Histidine kinase [uncultured Aureispira sp.]|uniref:histidine kinase n=1 Tax=uncultured Aureispira sp. TaxID=1331704 RepID=A0A6S6TEZ3_9BACT|nr:MAG: Histidine kinase [uncultured Aureispira sp.]